MSRARPHNTSLWKSAGFLLIGCSLVTFGIALAPIVPAAQYETEQLFEKIKFFPSRFQQKEKAPELQEIVHLPVNRDRVFAANSKSEAFKIIGQVEAATATNAVDANDREKEAENTPPATNISNPTNEDPASKTPSVSLASDSTNTGSDTIAIAKANIKMDIVQGSDAKTSLSKGAWHIPGTSTPDKGGNTVISCHRYLYTSGPNVSKNCYHLDKVKKGDTIEVQWNGKTYKYHIFEKVIVKPSAVEILDNTADPILTIFTCNPVFSTKERLVVKAKLIK